MASLTKQFTPTPNDKWLNSVETMVKDNDDSFLLGMIDPLIERLTEFLRNIPIPALCPVLISGGCSHSNIIKNAVKSVWKDNNIIDYGDDKTDFLVSRGACLYAMSLVPSSSQCRQLTLVDVVPLSLGVGLDDGRMITMIKKNSNVPTYRTQTFLTTPTDLDQVTVGIYQGERAFTEDNLFLGNVILPNRPNKIRIMFNVSCSGVLTVQAEDVENKTNTSTRCFDKDQIIGISSEVVGKAVEDSIVNRNVDLQKERQIVLRSQLSELIEVLKRNKYSGTEQLAMRLDMSVTVLDDTIKYIFQECRSYLLLS